MTKLKELDIIYTFPKKLKNKFKSWKYESMSVYLHLYPGFYSYTEGATWKILDLLLETLLI